MKSLKVMTWRWVETSSLISLAVRPINAHFTHDTFLLLFTCLESWRCRRLLLLIFFVQSTAGCDINRRVLFRSFSNAKRHVAAFSFLSNKRAERVLMKLNTFLVEALALFDVWRNLNNRNGIVMNAKLAVYKSIHAGHWTRLELCCISLHFRCFFCSQKLRQPARESQAAAVWQLLLQVAFMFMVSFPKVAFYIHPITYTRIEETKFTSKSLHFQNCFSPFRRLFFYGFTESFFHDSF